MPEIKLSKPLFADVKGSSWFQDQQSGDYVLQLIGARDKATLEIFIQTEGTIIDKLASFTTYNEAMLWYVLVYGIYPDRDSTAADIANLPASIQAHQPWPRSII